MKSLAASLLALTLLAAPILTHADTIVQTFTTGNIDQHTSKTVTFSLDKFDPTSGTLNSVTAMISGTYQIDEVRFDVVRFDFMTIDGGTLVSENAFEDQGSYTLSQSSTSNDAGTLAFLSGTGQAQFQFLLNIGADEELTSTSPNGFTLVLDYNYTPATPPPAAATPEPSCLILLAAPTLVAAFHQLRRRATLTRI